MKNRQELQKKLSQNNKTCERKWHNNINYGF